MMSDYLNSQVVFKKIDQSITLIFRIIAGGLDDV